MRFTGVALIAAALLQGCFFEPGRPGNGPSDGATDSATDGATDGQGSSNGPAPVARLIQHAWFCGGSASLNMQQTGYWITTSGIADGDLVLFIANIDNGANNIITLPSGFTKVYETYYDASNDGQTFVVGYKIVSNASTEGGDYSSLYDGANLHSGCAVVMLIGVTGYDPVTPIDAKSMTAAVSGMNPINLQNQLTTTRANTRILFTGGADWFTSGGDGIVTFTEPTGFDTLDELTDTGGSDVVWSSQLVATRASATAGEIVSAHATMSSAPAFSGAPWTVELAIAPGP